MTDKTSPALPFADFVIGSIKGAVADAHGSKRDRFFVPRSAILVKEDFNVRDDTKEYREHVETIARSIAANGFYPSKGIACVVEKGEDGKSLIYAKDGHTRLLAVDYAVEKLGATIELLPIDVVPPGTTAEDITISLVTENAGRPLSPFEVGKVCKRLIDFGMEDKEIARRLSLSLVYVRNLLSLTGAPKAVREMVQSGKVSATLAVETLKKEGANAAKVLKAAEAVATTKGKAKVTKKAVKATKPAPAKVAAKDAPGRQYPVILTATRLPDQPTAIMLLVDRDFTDDELAAIVARLG